MLLRAIEGALIPAKAGIQCFAFPMDALDPRLRGDDESGRRRRDSEVGLCGTTDRNRTCI